MNIPYLAVGNGELDGNPSITDEDSIICPHCKKNHKVLTSKSDSGNSGLQYYKCGKKAYVCGLDGTALGGVKLKNGKNN